MPVSPRVTTSDLTLAERVFLYRRRAGLTQAEAAEEAGVSVYQYRALERGEREDPVSVPLGRLRPHERCVILRRRAGLTIDRFAQLVRLSRWWVVQMERGAKAPDALVELWKSPPPSLHAHL